MASRLTFARFAGRHPTPAHRSDTRAKAFELIKAPGGHARTVIGSTPTTLCWRSRLRLQHGADPNVRAGIIIPSMDVQVEAAQDGVIIAATETKTTPTRAGGGRNSPPPTSSRLWLTARQRFNQHLLGQTAYWTLAERTVLLLPNQNKKMDILVFQTAH